jgi:hypothetical protein
MKQTEELEERSVCVVRTPMITLVVCVLSTSEMSEYLLCRDTTYIEQCTYAITC